MKKYIIPCVVTLMSLALCTNVFAETGNAKNDAFAVLAILAITAVVAVSTILIKLRKRK